MIVCSVRDRGNVTVPDRPSKTVILVADFRHDDSKNEHVVVFFESCFRYEIGDQGWDGSRTLTKSATRPHHSFAMVRRVRRFQRRQGLCRCSFLLATQYKGPAATSRRWPTRGGLRVQDLPR